MCLKETKEMQHILENKNNKHVLCHVEAGTLVPWGPEGRLIMATSIDYLRLQSSSPCIYDCIDYCILIPPYGHVVVVLLISSLGNLFFLIMYLLV